MVTFLPILSKDKIHISRECVTAIYWILDRGSIQRQRDECKWENAFIMKMHTKAGSLAQGQVRVALGISSKVKWRRGNFDAVLREF